MLYNSLEEFAHFILSEMRYYARIQDKNAGVYHFDSRKNTEIHYENQNCWSICECFHHLYGNYSISYIYKYLFHLITCLSVHLGARLSLKLAVIQVTSSASLYWEIYVHWTWTQTYVICCRHYSSILLPSCLSQKMYMGTQYINL